VCFEGAARVREVEGSGNSSEARVGFSLTVRSVGGTNPRLAFCTVQLPTEARLMLEMDAPNKLLSIARRTREWRTLMLRVYVVRAGVEVHAGRGRRCMAARGPPLHMIA
jgi:hypothetical protein